MKEIAPKKWSKMVIILLASLVLGVALLTYIVDPYFHYHKPIKGLKYRMYEQQYINDGIARHFEYDTIIIGNSLSENMQASQVDELFDCKSIKIPYSGAGYKELWSAIGRALEYNNDVKTVYVMLDMDDAVKGEKYVRYSNYPEYLYDDSIWNDAKYLWNKDIFYRGVLYNLMMTFTGKESTTFDEYSTKVSKTGAEVVIPMIGEIPQEPVELRIYEEDDIENVIENINTNVFGVTKEYPDTEFVLIYAPFSIAKWARYYGEGEVDYRLQSIETAIECFLTQENITLYSFQDDFSLVCDMDYYRDTVHYSVEACEYMMENIAMDKEPITKENYLDYCNEISEFYSEYDYSSLRMDKYFKQED